MRYFPIFLDLQEKRCVVVGGGRVAERKAMSLLKAGARVTVVSPQMTVSLRRLQGKGKIKHLPRPFRSGDLNGAHLVIAATDNRQANERIFRLASALRIPVNIVDDPVHCSFIVPSIISRGDILLAISTGGQSPALAKALREKLEKTIGSEYNSLLKILGAVRKRILPLGWGATRKQKIFRLLLGEDFLRIIRQRRFSAVEARVEKIIGSRIPLKDLGLKL
jgi:precorrin-2 dehydrogenase / sirohydrochlorin ferrochelatase